VKLTPAQLEAAAREHGRKMDADIENDLKSFGVAYTVEGVRVNPVTVVTYGKKQSRNESEGMTGKQKKRMSKDDEIVHCGDSLVSGPYGIVYKIQVGGTTTRAMPPNPSKKELKQALKELELLTQIVKQRIEQAL
jgi:hypothetical protein